MSYQHGVNLAEALEPGSSKRMTQEELIALPEKMSAAAVTPEQEELIAATRVGPALEWAVANGVLEEKTDYSQAEIHEAITALNLHFEKMANAVSTLTTPMPMRKNYFIGTQLVSPIKGHADPDNPKYPVALYDDKKFAEDFKVDLASKKAAYGTIIQQLVATLPLPDRIAIGQGEVEVYAMKAPGEGGELERTEFLIKTVHKGKTTVYQIAPERGTATKRDDFIKLFNGNDVIGKQKLSDGSYSSVFTAWERPNIQDGRYQPRVDHRPGAALDNTPFSAQLHTLEPLAKWPAAPEDAEGSASPQASFLERSNQIGTAVSQKLFYAKDLDLLLMAEEDPERVTESEKKDRENYQTFKEDREKRRQLLKGFVPFWRGIEAIIDGRPIEGIAQIWIDILTFMMPVEKAAAGVVRAGFQMIKRVIPKFLKLSTNFASYTFKPGVAGIKWEGGVQGLKWTSSASKGAAKGAEQFRGAMATIPLTQPGVREIELGGIKYFVAAKPDAGDGVHYSLRVVSPDDSTKLINSGKVAKPDEAGVWKMPERAGRDVSGAPMTQMKGTMQELGVLGGEIHTFTDIYKGETRLNVVAHGIERSPAEVAAGVPSKVMVDGKAYSAKELVAYLKTQGIDPANPRYKNVRLLICYAADGGKHSFASDFQKIVGKPVKAFEGTVTTSHGATAMEYVRKELIKDMRALHPDLDDNGIELLVQAEIEKLFSQKSIFVNKADGTLVQIQTAPQGANIGEHILRIEYKPVHFTR
ncbi:hypothetical protein [Pseudomonas sp. CYM-20-01]|uniref:hypothetical protein n=1 Tax=Pseudomonas sp. CYM-20-01 TaxID=2870750 RepID=UPI0020C01FE0|nr:hypothetical protein [Pseudomonas sp. CYM-20-01]